VDTVNAEPPIGSVVRIDDPSLQRGWCWYRTAVGWVRILRDGELDTASVVTWSALESHGVTLLYRPLA
jgi:hypothetical protein